MAKKRKPAGNGKLRPYSRFPEENEARLRERYGDKKFEFLRDRELTDNFFEGQPLVDEDGELVDYQFLKPGSRREQEAMAAIARTLASVSRFIQSPEIWSHVERVLVFAFLRNLAALIDPHQESPRKFVVQARYDGKPPNRRREWLIADEVACEVKAGTQVAAAWELVGERFGCSARTVQRIWKKQRRAALDKHRQLENLKQRRQQENLETNQTSDLSLLKTNRSRELSSRDKSKLRFGQRFFLLTESTL